MLCAKNIKYVTCTIKYVTDSINFIPRVKVKPLALDTLKADQSCYLKKYFSWVYRRALFLNSRKNVRETH